MDPIVSANIYCNLRLDHVVHGAVLPWLDRLRSTAPDAGWGVWWVRYARNGDHLKVRLHGPAEHAGTARRLLDEATRSFFSELPAADPGEERRNRPRSPAVDPEDDTTELSPDRTLTWTRYRRSPVSLGPLHLDDDRFVSRITECFLAGAELVMGSSAGTVGPLPERTRQTTLLLAAVSGLSGRSVTSEVRALYLAYHRDWLLRTVANDQPHEATLRSAFERRTGEMPALVEQVRAVAEGHWGAVDAAAYDAGPGARLRDAVEALRDFAAPFGQDPERFGDPFAHDASFPLVFKALHGVANQIGVPLLSEAWFYHLLYTAAGEGAAPRVLEAA